MAALCCSAVSQLTQQTPHVREHSTAIPQALFYWKILSVMSITALQGVASERRRYGFFWYFYQDGTIQHEVKLTGILSTNGLSEGEVRSQSIASNCTCCGHC